jgi:hypothetical protein
VRSSRHVQPSRHVRTAHNICHTRTLHPDVCPAALGHRHPSQREKNDNLRVETSERCGVEVVDCPKRPTPDSLGFTHALLTHLSDTRGTAQHPAMGAQKVHPPCLIQSERVSANRLGAALVPLRESSPPNWPLRGFSAAPRAAPCPCDTLS